MHISPLLLLLLLLRYCARNRCKRKRCLPTKLEITVFPPVHFIQMFSSASNGKGSCVHRINTFNCAWLVLKSSRRGGSGGGGGGGGGGDGWVGSEQGRRMGHSVPER